MPPESGKPKAEWSGFGPALAYLRERKIIPDANGYFHIASGQYLSKKSWRALDYLVQEWDYGWTWK